MTEQLHETVFPEDYHVYGLNFLTLCMLGNFCCLRYLLIFFKTISKESFRNTIRMSNSLHLDQARHFVRPDLYSNCLQSLSADDKIFFSKLYLSKESVRNTIRVSNSLDADQA